MPASRRALATKSTRRRVRQNTSTPLRLGRIFSSNSGILRKPGTAMGRCFRFAAVEPSGSTSRRTGSVKNRADKRSTCFGMVALKRRCCRPAGSSDSRDSIWGKKPMSIIRSASSMAATERLHQSKIPFSPNSRTRPGVATRSSALHPRWPWSAVRWVTSPPRRRL